MSSVSSVCNLIVASHFFALRALLISPRAESKDGVARGLAPGFKLAAILLAIGFAYDGDVRTLWKPTVRRGGDGPPGPLVVIASDRRERGNLIRQVGQRIEIATPACGRFAMTGSRVYQQAHLSGPPSRKYIRLVL